VAEANDLKPRMVRLFKYTGRPSSPLPAPYRPVMFQTPNRAPPRGPAGAGMAGSLDVPGGHSGGAPVLVPV
jgi:hypothetical protein